MVIRFDPMLYFNLSNEKNCNAGYIKCSRWPQVSRPWFKSHIFAFKRPKKTLWEANDAKRLVAKLRHGYLAC